MANVILVNRETEWEAAYESLLEHMQTTRVIGFDCEWVEINNWRRLYYEPNEKSTQRHQDTAHSKHKLPGGKAGDPENKPKRVKGPKSAHATSQQAAASAQLSDGEIVGSDEEADQSTVCQGETNENSIDAVRLNNTWLDRVSLVQMAAHDGFTVLVRLVLFRHVPKSLQAFLEDGRIVKVGVNIFADCSRLYRDWGIMVSSWLDIRYLLKDLPDSKLIEPIRNGLKAIGEIYCDKTKKHDDTMSYSNWCSRELTRDQIHYASQDARIAVDSYAALGKSRLNSSRLTKTENASKSSEMPAEELKTMWNAIHNSASMHLNSKFDHDRYMSQKMGGSGVSKKKKLRDDLETSDSDLDLAVEKLNLVLSVDQNDQRGRKTDRLYPSRKDDPSNIDTENFAAAFLRDFFYDYEGAACEKDVLVQCGRKKFSLKWR